MKLTPNILSVFAFLDSAIKDLSSITTNEDLSEFVLLFHKRYIELYTSKGIQPILKKLEEVGINIMGIIMENRKTLEENLSSKKTYIQEVIKFMEGCGDNIFK